MDIINDLKALRESGLSESEIARRCHVPQATIWRLLNVEDSRPSYKTIQRIWPVLYGDRLPAPVQTTQPDRQEA